MQYKLIFRSILPLILFLALAPAALASNTWYVDGVNGNDGNDCLSSQTACQTIGHAISLCSSGDTIMVAPAIYMENLTIGFSLKVIGSGAKTTIIDGGGVATVVTISGWRSHVILSKVTIQNGAGGVYNSATLTINNSTISGNSTSGPGGGIENEGILTVNYSTVSGNSAFNGGGIENNGTLTVNHTTVSRNSASVNAGGIDNNSKYLYYGATLTIDNSTVSGNSAYNGGGILNDSQLGDGPAKLTIASTTISGNSAYSRGGISNSPYGATTTLQDTIVANSPSGGNCDGTMTSNGYNLSSDNTCQFNGPGDLNNTDPKLGQLKDNGGPTQTMWLRNGSSAIDAGNPNGCTDDKGNLLKTDQRGWPRPGKHDQGKRCDMGAVERQHE